MALFEKILAGVTKEETSSPQIGQQEIIRAALQNDIVEGAVLLQSFLKPVNDTVQGFAIRSGIFNLPLRMFVRQPLHPIHSYRSAYQAIPDK